MVLPFFNTYFQTVQIGMASLGYVQIEISLFSNIREKTLLRTFAPRVAKQFRPLRLLRLEDTVGELV